VFFFPLGFGIDFQCYLLCLIKNRLLVCWVQLWVGEWVERICFIVFEFIWRVFFVWSE